MAKKYNKNREMLIEQFKRPELWQPNFSRIARETGIAVSTVFDHFKRLQREGKLAFMVHEYSDIVLRERQLAKLEEETQNGNR